MGRKGNVSKKEKNYLEVEKQPYCVQIGKHSEKGNNEKGNIIRKFYGINGSKKLTKWTNRYFG